MKNNVSIVSLPVSERPNNPILIEYKKTIATQDICSHLLSICEFYSNNIAFYCYHGPNSTSTVTYHEFLQLICRYLSFFEQINIKHGEFLGVHLPPGVELFSAMVACWFAGIVYVPLSVNIDNKKLSYRISDSGISHIVTSQQYQSPVQQIASNINIHLVDEISSLTLATPSINDVKRASDDAAMIIYTSGTTSESKGILISHQALMSRWLSHWDTMELTPTDRVLNFFDIQTDPSVMEAIMAFCSAASLCVNTLARSEFVVNLPDIVQSLQVSVAIFPPSYLESLVNLHKNTKHYLEKYFQSLRLITSATEAVKSEVLTVWQYRGSTLPERAIVLGYGSTETTVGSMICRYQNESTVPLGGASSAFYGNKIYLLKDDVLHDDINSEGQLCIAGIGLGKYWKNGQINTDLTNKYFKKLPTTDGRQAFVYLSGDKVLLKDRVYYFIARIDRQLKIAGNRLEPEYIEKTINLHQNITHSRVIKHQNRLVALIVLADPSKPPPSYHSIVNVISNHSSKNNSADIPLNFYIATKAEITAYIAGQLNINSLPILEPKLSKTELANSDYQECVVIQAIWKKLFEREIAIDCDFIEAGGYSLLLSELLARLNDEFKVKLQFHMLPQPLTIKNLADHIVLIKVQQQQFKVLQSHLNSAANLICFPPISGSGEIEFLEFTHHLPAINSYLVISPIVELLSDEKRTLQTFLTHVQPTLSLQNFARVLALLILERFSAKPILLCGWSYGGLLSSEVALWLQQFSSRVNFQLFIFDSLPQNKTLQSSQAEHYRRIEAIMLKIATDCKSVPVAAVKYESLFDGSETKVSHVNCVYQRIMSANSSTEHSPLAKIVQATRCNLMITCNSPTTKPELKLINTTLFVASETDTTDTHRISGSWNQLVAPDSFVEITVNQTNHSNILKSSEPIDFIIDKIQFCIAGRQPTLTQPDKPKYLGNIPNRNKLFTGRTTELARLQQGRDKLNNTNCLQHIIGTSGVGKSQLLSEYIHQSIAASYYSLILFSTANALANQFKLFAEDLNIPVKQTDQIDRIVRKVYQEIDRLYLREKQFVLIAFDDAENPAAINEFLPASTIQIGIHCVVTSTYQSWQNTELIPLNPFNETDVRHFFSHYLPASSQQNQQLTEFANQILGNLPLALAQAAAYMVNVDCSPTDYITLFQQSAADKIALLSEWDQQQGDSYNKTIWTTCSLNISKLIEKSTAALHLLVCIALLDGEHLDKFILGNLIGVQPPNAKLNTLIKHLLAYSFLEKNHYAYGKLTAIQGYKIHKLTQTVLREMLHTDYFASVTFCEIFTKITNSLCPLTPRKRDASSTANRIRYSLLTHLVALEFNSRAHFSKLQPTVLQYMLKQLLNILYRTRLHQLTIEIYEQSIQPIETLKCTHAIQFDLAATLSRLNKIQQAKQIFLELLSSLPQATDSETTVDEDSGFIMRGIVCYELALIYFYNEGNYQLFREYALQSLVIFKPHADIIDATLMANCYGLIASLELIYSNIESAIEYYELERQCWEKYEPRNIQCAIVDSNIATIYLEMCLPFEAIAYLQRALSIIDSAAHDRQTESYRKIITYGFSNYHFRVGNYAMAEQSFKKAAGSTTIECKHFTEARSQFGLIKSQIAQSKSAEQSSLTMLVSIIDLVTDKSPYSISLKADLSMVYLYLNNFKEAMRWHNLALENTIKLFPDAFHMQATILFTTAKILLKLNLNSPDAIQMCDQAIRLMEQSTDKLIRQFKQVVISTRALLSMDDKPLTTTTFPPGVGH